MIHYTNDRIHRAPHPAAFGGRVLVAAAIVGVITLACGSRELSDPGTETAALRGSGEPIAASTSTVATHCFAESASLTGTLRLTGPASARWTFQIGTTLDADDGSNVILSGGASADNVSWAVDVPRRS